MEDIATMTRPQVIQELARYAHPTWYHDLLTWKTRHLKILLAYYQGEATIEVGFKATEYNGDEIVDCDLLEVSLVKHDGENIQN